MAEDDFLNLDKNMNDIMRKSKKFLDFVSLKMDSIVNILKTMPKRTKTASLVFLSSFRNMLW